MAQYDDYISRNVGESPDSVPKLIRLAPRKVWPSPPASGGENWKGRHGFLNGDMWGAVQGEKRAYVEGYMACERKPVDMEAVDRCVKFLDQHFSDPKRSRHNLADVLEPLLSQKSSQNP